MYFLIHQNNLAATFRFKHVSSSVQNVYIQGFIFSNKVFFLTVANLGLNSKFSELWRTEQSVISKDYQLNQENLRKSEHAEENKVCLVCKMWKLCNNWKGMNFKKL